jgi:hypothetical protein
MKKFKLDRNFVERLKTEPLENTPFVSMYIESEQYVSGSLDHNFNFKKLSGLVYEYYTLPIRDLILKKQSNYQLGTLMGYSELPYIPFYNGSFMRLDLLISRLECILKREYPASKKIKYLDDLSPYFKDYARGFKTGFEYFSQNELEPLIKFERDNEKANHKAFEFINENWIKGKDFGYDPIFLEMEEKFGEEEGYLYGVWSYVMENQCDFLPIFENRYNELRTRGAFQFKKLENGSPTIIKSSPENYLEPKGKKKVTYKGKHYALSYYFDCEATGKESPIGQKNKLEEILFEKANGKKDGNTIYKRFNELTNNPPNTEQDLIKICGEEWKEILLDLSEHSQTLEQYLRKHF